jgi:hypothetical protein
LRPLPPEMVSAHVEPIFRTYALQQPDEDDWKKLLRMLKYINVTKDLELALEAADGEI